MGLGSPHWRVACFLLQQCLCGRSWVLRIQPMILPLSQDPYAGSPFWAITTGLRTPSDPSALEDVALENFANRLRRDMMRNWWSCRTEVTEPSFRTSRKQKVRTEKTWVHWENVNQLLRGLHKTSCHQKWRPSYPILFLWLPWDPLHESIKELSSQPVQNRGSGIWCLWQTHPGRRWQL